MSCVGICSRCKRHARSRTGVTEGHKLLGAFAGVQHQVDVIEFLWAAMGLFAEGADEAEATAVYRLRWADLYAVGDARERILRLLAETPEGGPLGWFLQGLSGQGSIRMPAELRRRAAGTNTFLASRQLARESEVDLAQDGPFALIHICKVPPTVPGSFERSVGIEEMISD